MRSLDLAPLYRATVGFDQVADLMDRVFTNGTSETGYPPYNIEKAGEDAWRISVAVAGFTPDELAVEQREKSLVISGRKADEAPVAGRVWLHRGIAARAFERRFHLAEHVVVTDARHENGILHVDLVRNVPEALKPRRIAIGAVTGAKADAGTIDASAVPAN